VLGVNPVREPEKLPVPLPSVVLLFAMVGLGLGLQHTPLAVTVAPPSDVILPPLDALVEVIEDIALVTMVGAVTIGLISQL